jgi:hypothetical protein
MSPAVIGFLRGLATVVVFAVVGYVANAANLTPVLGGSVATIVAALALALEHGLSPSGTAGFGAISTQ